MAPQEQIAEKSTLGQTLTCACTVSRTIIFVGFASSHDLVETVVFVEVVEVVQCIEWWGGGYFTIIIKGSEVRVSDNLSLSMLTVTR